MFIYNKYTQGLWKQNPQKIQIKCQEHEEVKESWLFLRGGKAGYLQGNFT